MDPQPTDESSLRHLARRMAEVKGVDLAALNGSGPHGRIVKRDIETAEARRTRKLPSARRTPLRGARRSGEPVAKRL